MWRMKFFFLREAWNKAPNWWRRKRRRMLKQENGWNHPFKENESEKGEDNDAVNFGEPLSGSLGNWHIKSSHWSPDLFGLLVTFFYSLINFISAAGCQVLVSSLRLSWGRAGFLLLLLVMFIWSSSALSGYLDFLWPVSVIKTKWEPAGWD